MFAIAVDSQVCQKERGMTNKKKTITATYYTEEGFLVRYLPYKPPALALLSLYYMSDGIIKLKVKS